MRITASSFWLTPSFPNYSFPKSFCPAFISSCAHQPIPGVHIQWSLYPLVFQTDWSLLLIDIKKGRKFGSYFFFSHSSHVFTALGYPGTLKCSRQLREGMVPFFQPFNHYLLFSTKSHLLLTLWGSLCQKVTLICLLQIITSSKSPTHYSSLFPHCVWGWAAHTSSKSTFCTVRAMSTRRKTKHFKRKDLDA